MIPLSMYVVLAKEIGDEDKIKWKSIHFMD